MQPIVFFDGVCGLCNRWVDLLLRLDRRQTLQFAPLQGTTARQWLGPPVTPLETMIVLDSAGLYERSEAALRILYHLGGGWRGLALALRWIPLTWRDSVYNFVARHRYQWFGQSASCRLPQTPQEIQSFLP